ncbi:MAG TPA: CHAD domain-containing protein [Bryobacteraceae bacterium]|nr:CHAD domain-containing protein [Bryobacteraceae bacterium]
MAYRFEPGEPVPGAVRRILREELESAARELSRARSAAARDLAIHEARKSIKKSRALLRLLLPELKGVYAAENPRLRELGLRLSEARDAVVMLETLSHLEEKYNEELDARALVPVRRALARRKREHEHQARSAALLHRTAAALRAAARRMKAWPLDGNGFVALATGFKRTFRRGRQALADARKHPVPENDHTLRKRVKDHWYHVRLLEDFAGNRLEAYERSLKDLETWLGECHNLVVLRETLRAEPSAFGPPEAVSALAGLIDHHERALRAKALALGGRIYGRKPGPLVRGIERLWNARQPDKATLSAVPVASGKRAARPGRR